MSLEEYFWEGPKILVPPCSFPPLAGAQVGRAAVVILFSFLSPIQHTHSSKLVQKSKKTKPKPKLNTNQTIKPRSTKIHIHNHNNCAEHSLYPQNQHLKLLENLNRQVIHQFVHTIGTIETSYDTQQTFNSSSIYKSQQLWCI